MGRFDVLPPPEKAWHFLRGEMVTHYSDQAFRNRITACAKARGESLASLLRRAGVAHDTFYKRGPETRRIDVIERLADAAGITVTEALGLTEATVEPSPADLFRRACDLADEMMDDLPRRADYRRVWQANVLDLFDWLRERRAAGADPSNDETRSVVQAFRRRLLHPPVANPDHPGDPA